MSVYIESAEQARRSDQCAIQEYGIPSLVLMEHAARGCAEQIRKLFPHPVPVLILAGPGNNGGDGLAIARLLDHAGWKQVRLFLPPESKMSPDEAVQARMVRKLGLTCTTELSQALSWLQQSELVVDALFGSGLSRPLGGDYAALVEAVNQSPVPVIAIDIPSGLHGTSGEVMGTAIKAAYTFALDCIKEGELIQQGPAHAGTIIPLDITIPEAIHQSVAWPARLLDASTAASCLPARPNDSYKGTFGKALMIGGSSRMHGALLMAARACEESGIGTLTLFLPACIGDIAAMRMDEAMLLRAPDADGVFSDEAVAFFEKMAPAFTVISIGNGMQKGPSQQKLVDAVLQSDKPVVIDADAIELAARSPYLKTRTAPFLITPHVGEMSQLTGVPICQLEADPLPAIRSFLETHPQGTLLFKSDSLWIGHGNELFYFSHPNAALAKGGSGDLLCGLCTALAGQSPDLFKDALAAVWLQSQAARTDKDTACFGPQDWLSRLPAAFKALRQKAFRSR